MKIIEMMIGTALFATCTLAQAEEQTKRPPHKLPPELLAKFDKDGDGKLSKEERVALKQERKAKILAKFDQDGDGTLSDAERAIMTEKRAELLKKFDANANGRLDPEEINAARNAGEKVRKFGKHKP